MNGFGYIVGIGSWAVLIFIFFGIFAFIIAPYLDRRIVATKKDNIYAAVFYGVCCLSVVFTPLYVEFPKYPNRLFTIDDEIGKKQEHPFGAFEYGKRLAWVPHSSEELGRFNFHVPLVDSSKNRVKMFCKLHGKITDPMLYLEKHGNWFTIWNTEPNNTVEDTVKIRIEYLSYEYTRSHVGPEMDDFYNPLDTNQQLRFKKIVETWFNERTKAEGVTVVVDEFSM